MALFLFTLTHFPCHSHTHAHAGLATIGECAFNGTGVTSLTLPSALVTVPKGAFNDLVELTSVTMPGAQIINF